MSIMGNGGEGRGASGSGSTGALERERGVRGSRVVGPRSEDLEASPTSSLEWSERRRRCNTTAA